jgi:glycosyltransferase involved in cell wall biosynthesis
VNQAAVVVFWVLLGLVVGQGLMVSRYVWALCRWKRGAIAERQCPKVAVILCVRGPDPFLAACVRNLLAQDYPQYDVRVVIDSREDPAWQVIEEVVRREQATNVALLPLRDRRGTCSLKIAGMLQGISTLDESHEVVALLDSDTVPHRTWLRELVAPLADERVAAAAGNRWYMPAAASWGSLIRYLWNAAAVVQMYWYGIAWGGSLVLRTSVFRESDLLDRLGHAFGEDSTICRTLARQKLRAAFVPSAMMVNRETCNVAGFFRFVVRQLLTVRLHNPWWWAVVGHGIVTSAAQAVAAALLLVGLWTGHWEAAARAGGALALYLAAMVLLGTPMEVCVRRIVRARGEPADWLTPLTMAKILPAIPGTQAVYFAGLVATMFVRQHRWRGIVYRFGGGQKVRVIVDRPYQAGDSAADATTSL